MISFDERRRLNLLEFNAKKTFSLRMHLLPNFEMYADITDSSDGRFECKKRAGTLCHRGAFIEKSEVT
ncbi:hypothetical protein L596_005816 [Steinernema carpocapsae]|uniref:Uncharacterized protein n=1 Tax=Steinernema carpocapsae TaxID=34508 RepID=A0A4U8V080_STECR|nr:hypothetical protein L596_005816 [Steinernema carpocapsae]